MSLPSLDLGNGPVRHPDCCLSLSSVSLQLLAQTFSSNNPTSTTLTVLSIGSGSGLLEALLNAHIQSPRPTGSSQSAALGIEGVEVQRSSSKDPVNKYLPEQAIFSVKGTWAVVSRLWDPDVSALLFVYPRQPALVSEYVKAVVEQDLAVKTAVWLGPMADWVDFEACFHTRQETEGSTFKVDTLSRGSDAGLDDYEMMVVLKR